MADEKAQQLRKKVQKDVLDLISKKLKSGKMSQDRAKRIADMVIKKLPEDISYEEIMKVIPKLDDEFIELSEIVVPIMVEYEKKLHKYLEARVLELVRKGKYKEARNAAKKAIEIEKNLA